MTASLRQSEHELSFALETAELARREADAASRAKSEFLANMSHEIRTPMTAILGFTELLAESEPTPEERRKHLATVRRNGEHLLAIINDILDLSKIESGRLDVEAVAVRPRAIIDEVITLLATRAEGKGIALDPMVDSDVPAVVRTDPVRLRQVLVNLAGNAVKFTEAGSVRISAERDPADANRLRFAVTDTGIGISAEKITQIFQPFAQADSSTTRTYGGTGLGLAISGRLVAMLGGELAAKSEVGRGSTFTFSIRAPVVASEEHAPPRTLESLPPEGPVTRGGRVLLAEDGLDNQRLIWLVLEKAGYIVDIAENGAIALERALVEWRAGTPYDVILMDMQMPEMDGYTATQRLREEGYEGQIVALTAHAMARDRDRCLAAGCDEFASKPIDRRSLIRVVANACAVSSRIT
jgi:CheY-like chemotaxis protein/nitrogen-specific signal transduction histidine kinase